MVNPRSGPQGGRQAGCPSAVQAQRSCAAGLSTRCATGAAAELSTPGQAEGARLLPARVRAWFLLDEKGGPQNKGPVHHQAAEYLEQYLAAVGIGSARETWLFRSLGRGQRGAVTERGLSRREVYAMVRRRTRKVGLPPEIRCHSFRGTGITNYLKNGGTIKVAARIAGHSSTRTTQLYDRRHKDLEQGEIERLRF